MNTERKDRQARVNFIVFLCIILLFSLIMFRFFEIIQASLEEMAAEINVLTLQQTIRNQNVVSGKSDLSCAYLNKADAFPFAHSKSGWSYDAKQHQLIYAVKSKGYFSSKFDQKVILDLYCNKGVIMFKESPFQWCREKRIWGCADK